MRCPSFFTQLRLLVRRAPTPPSAPRRGVVPQVGRRRLLRGLRDRRAYSSGSLTLSMTSERAPQRLDLGRKSMVATRFKVTHPAVRSAPSRQGADGTAPGPPRAWAPRGSGRISARGRRRRRAGHARRRVAVSPSCRPARRSRPWSTTPAAVVACWRPSSRAFASIASRRWRRRRRSSLGRPRSRPRRSRGAGAAAMGTAHVVTVTVTGSSCASTWSSPDRRDAVIRRADRSERPDAANATLLRRDPPGRPTSPPSPRPSRRRRVRTSRPGPRRRGRSLLLLAVCTLRVARGETGSTTARRTP